MPIVDMEPHDLTPLHAVAKKAAEDAGRNAKAAPNLLFAPILWALQDALKAGVLTVVEQSRQ